MVAGGGRAIRWDRVGRVALLMVLLGVVALYVGPSLSFLHTYRESKARRKYSSPRRLASSDCLRCRLSEAADDAGRLQPARNVVTASDTTSGSAPKRLPGLPYGQ